MANFNTEVGLNPKYGLSIENNPNINTISFGDGFEQRLTEMNLQVNLLLILITKKQ